MKVRSIPSSSLRNVSSRKVCLLHFVLYVHRRPRIALVTFQQLRPAARFPSIHCLPDHCAFQKAYHCTHAAAQDPPCTVTLLASFPQLHRCRRLIPQAFCPQEISMLSPTVVLALLLTILSEVSESELGVRRYDKELTITCHHHWCVCM